MRRRQIGPILPCGNPPPGFRFLHDEVSGGLSAISQMQCKASYNCEDIYNIYLPESWISTTPAPNTFFPLKNGYAPLADMAAVATSNTRLTVVDQIDLSAILGRAGQNGPGFNGSNLMIGGGLLTGSGNFPRSQSTGFTVFALINRLDLLSGFIWNTNTPRIQRISGVIRCWVGTAASNYVGKNYAQSVFDITADCLVCFTYDGSGTSAGIDLFVNNMATPLSGTSVSAGTYLDDNYTPSNNGQQTQSTSLYKEMHVWDGRLSQAQRQTVKDIFNQYYTIP